MTALSASFQFLRFIINCVIFAVMLVLGFVFFAADLVCAATRFFVLLMDTYASKTLDDDRMK